MKRDPDIYFNKNHGPKKCTKCDGVHINAATKATDGGYASEVEYICNNCGTILGYWAYGSFDPCFIMIYLGE